MVQLDIIEMHDQSNDQKRSMLNLSIAPLEENKLKREIEIQQMCKVESGDTLNNIYSKLNEKFINEIIDQESLRPKFDGNSPQVKCPTCGGCPNQNVGSSSN